MDVAGDLKNIEGSLLIYDGGEWVATNSYQKTPVDVINEYLKSKGFPEFDEILDCFREHNPEYFL